MIICFSGFKGSGKDTMADYLVKNNGGVRVALADPLKDSVSEEYGIDRDSLDDPKRKELPILELPVTPKDDYSRMVAKFMVKEFRNASGKQPTSYYFDPDNNFLGSFPHKLDPNTVDLDPLYHTPRSLAILKGSTNRVVRSDFWTNKAFDAILYQLSRPTTGLVVVTDVRYKSELGQFKERFGDEVVFVRVNRHKESTSSDPSEMDLADTTFDFYIDNTTTLENAYSQLEQILDRIPKDRAMDELAKETENLNLQFK